MRRQRPFLCASVLVVTSSLAPAQNKPADTPADSGVIIRTETRLVLVDAIVTNKKGEYVRDLEAKNFKVYEDNREQPIKSFSFEADPQSPNHSDTHYMVLFFDNSTMQVGDQVRARQAAVKFIDANAGPDRKMAIVNFGGALQVAQNFTGNVERLKAIVNGVSFSSVSPNESGPRLSEAAFFGARDMILGLRTLAKNLGAVPGRKTLVMFTAGFKLTSEQISEVTATIDTCNKSNVAIYPVDVRGLVAGTPVASNLSGGSLIRSFSVPSWLAPALTLSFEPQRGGGVPGGAPGGTPGGSTPGGTGGGTRGSGPSAGNGATGGNTAAPGGTRGPSTPANPGTNNTGNAGGRGGGANNPLNPMNQPYPGMNPYNQSRSLIPKIPEGTVENQNVMYMLADGTGGFVIHDTNDLLAGLEKIGKEQNEYYLLGYTPAVSAEGSCHVLHVKVERSGTTVRARSGYCNAKARDILVGSPVEKQLETRAAATQVGNVAAAMQLPFFYTSPNVARVNVAMEIAGDSIKFEKQKNKLHGEINVLGIAYTANGSVAGRFSDTVKLDFDDKKEVEEFQKKPLHYEDQFELASGKYNLKVVFSSGGASFGKVETPLEIDPYESGQFAISALALSKKYFKTSELGTSLDASLLEDKVPLTFSGLQVVPSGTNEFKKGEPAIFYTEIYEPLLTTPDPKTETAVAIDMRVLDRKTGEQKSDTGLLRIDLAQQSTNPVIPLGEKMPVENLAPGSYTLEFSAIDTANHEFKRTADFELK